MTRFTSSRQVGSNYETLKSLEEERDELQGKLDDLYDILEPLKTEENRLLAEKLAAVSAGDEDEIKRLNGLLKPVELEIKPYADEVDRLTIKLGKVKRKIKHFKTPGDDADALPDRVVPVAARTDMQWPGKGSPSNVVMPKNGQTTQPGIPGQSAYGQSARQTSPNSLLLNSGGNPSTKPAAPKKSTSGYDDDFRAAAQVLYPGNSSNELPPLVRRDRQPLTQPERMYPVTGYDEDIYEPWPDDVIETAIKRYPDFRKKKTVARRLENKASGGINAPRQTTDPFEQSQDNGMYSGPNQRKNRWDFD